MFERGKLKEIFNIHFTYFKANAALSNVKEIKWGKFLYIYDENLLHHEENNSVSMMKRQVTSNDNCIALRI